MIDILHDKLWDIFESHGFNLWLVGGAVRNHLSGFEVTDVDFATDALPSEVEVLLKAYKYDFSTYAMKYGSIDVKRPLKCQITTLREEQDYVDNRHPKVIKYVKELAIDVNRRDFTINALYMDHQGNIIDLVNGLKDIIDKKLVMIGDSQSRITEDPLRIVRALRLCADYNFTLCDDLTVVINNNRHLLALIPVNKVKQEISKIKHLEHPLIQEYLKDFI